MFRSETTVLHNLRSAAPPVVNTISTNKACNNAFEDPLFAVAAVINIRRTNEVDEWCKEACIQATPLPFWAEHRMSSTTKYPRLAMQSLSIYGAPGVNDESERDFSALMLLCSSGRQSLKKEKVARRMFLKQNKEMWMANPELKKFMNGKRLTYTDLKKMIEAEDSDSDNDSDESDDSSA